MNAISTIDPTTTALTHGAHLDPGMLAGQVAAGTLAVYRRDLAQYTDWCAAVGMEPTDPGTLARWRAALVATVGHWPNLRARVRGVATADGAIMVHAVEVDL